MPTPPLTVDEIVATLSHSSVSTVIVEGDKDVEVYRWIEEELGAYTANVLACGGKTSLLAVFARREEFAHLRTAFLADQDMWLFSTVPAELEGIVFTEGYSIENDLYSHGRLERLLSRTESKQHEKVIDALAEWFAFEVEEFRAGREVQVASHASEIVPHAQTSLCQGFCERRGWRPPDVQTVNEIRPAYETRVRGKQLFQALVRFVSAPRRRAKHSLSGLYEIAVKTPTTHPALARILTEVSARLDGARPAA